ncbi:MAG: hypothetical protein ACK4NM_19440, partial [Hydrogenophaga sp.]
MPDTAAATATAATAATTATTAGTLCAALRFSSAAAADAAATAFNALARSAARKVCTPFLRHRRPPAHWSGSPLRALSLRRRALALAPLPVLRALAFALCVVAEEPTEWVPAAEAARQDMERRLRLLLDARRSGAAEQAVRLLRVRLLALAAQVAAALEDGELIMGV